jgi:prepilin-type N-terminal cleavage/methylation domain-containing protein
MRPDTENANDITSSMKRVKKQGGFTLIEVLIALTIFAVGLLAMAAMQTSAIRMNSTAGHLTEISSWSMDRLETLMGLPYTDPQLAAGNHPDPAPPNGYAINWTVAPGPVAKTIVITLTVTAEGKTLQVKATKSQSL